MKFEKNTFYSSKVTFPGLDINVFLPSNRYLRYDGVVDDINAHTKLVLSQFGRQDYHNVTSNKDWGRHIALSLTLTDIPVKASVIFSRAQSPARSLFNLGHESVHALIHLDQEKYFLDELRRQGFFFNPFERYSDEENIADVGGLLALYKSRFRREEFILPSDVLGVFHDMMASRKDRN